MNKTIAKFIAAGYLLSLFLLLLLPVSFVSAAATLKIGDRCQSNDQCLSGDCEESSKVDATGNKESYCDCDELGISKSEDCLQRYNAPADGGEWRCINGFDETYGLDYCISTNKENIFFAAPPTDEVSIRSKAINFFLNPTAASKIEVTDITADIKDTLAIKIPGLDFSKLTSTLDEAGYLYIPWIGQYIAAMYKFAVAMASIVAVIVIIIQGARIIISGGGEEKTAGYKRIGQVLLGLMILWGSYAIMYTINPALVSFTALKIKYIEPQDLSSLDYDPTADLSNTDNSAGPCAAFPSNGKGKEDCRKDCLQKLDPAKISKPSGSGIADNPLFGALDCMAGHGVRELSSIKFIVLHEGSSGAVLNWWWPQYATNGISKAFASHYMVDRGGVVRQIVDERFVVWHDGNLNGKSIGIDLDMGCNSGNGSDAESKKCNMTQAQYDGLKKLINEITLRTGVKLDDNSIVAHCQLGWSEKQQKCFRGDPRGLEWAKLGLDVTKHQSEKGNCCRWLK